MPTARLIRDTASAGTWNMAVDEALMHSAGTTGQLTLRIYEWAEPTLSMGYFQSYRARDGHLASGACEAVRRTTGGGTILHHYDITYSLTGPVRDRTDQQLHQWYDWVHDAWRDALAEQGLTASRCPQTLRDREHRFLCFERRAAGDLLLAGMKIGGSAQRRLPKAALQHGSILLRQSPAAPELPGIAELAGRALACQKWVESWVARLGDTLGIIWQEGTLTDGEREEARRIEQAKFAHSEWTHRR
jgi:lipoate-protein ligase A